MVLTPGDIEAQVFREKFKGYDQDQVDSFLDRVAADLTELVRERDEAIERMKRVEADAAESIEAERLLKRTLITAQRTADETVAEAVAQAQSTIAEADHRAAQTVADAEARAADIVQEAERRAADLVTQARREAESRSLAAEEQIQQVRRAVAELQRFRTEYRDRVRAAIAEQLAILDSAAEVPEVPPEMARLAAAPEPERNVQAEPESPRLTAAPESQRSGETQPESPRLTAAPEPDRGVDAGGGS